MILKRKKLIQAIESHEIYIQYREIIAILSFEIGIAIVQSVLECQHDE